MKKITITDRWGHKLTYNIRFDDYRCYATLVAIDGVAEDNREDCLFEWKHSDVYRASELSEQMVKIALAAMEDKT